jgi:hypothetical protein
MIKGTEGAFLVRYFRREFQAEYFRAGDLAAIILCLLALK